MAIILRNCDNNNNNNNNNTQNNMYSAVIYGTSHMREFTLDHLDNSRSAPVGCYRPNIHPSPFVLVCNQLIYRPSEGGRLSRPRHCSRCAARAQSCISRWFSWKTHRNIRQQCGSILGPLASQASVLPLDHCDLHNGGHPRYTRQSDRCLFGRNWIVGCICRKWSTRSSTSLASWQSSTPCRLRGAST